MQSHDLDAKLNGHGLTHPAAAGATGPETVHQLGHELAELARSLSGSLHRLSVRSGDCEIAVEWHAAPVTGVTAGPSPVESLVDASEVDAAVPTFAVRSPLVGTYFAAPAPDADPFVKPGDEVEPGQTLAIVEAMKMMNSVVAVESGIVAEILVSNGQSVEFDQPLVLLLPKEPAS